MHILSYIGGVFFSDYADFFQQPMQALIAQASLDAGGNPFNLNPNDGDRLWFDLGVSWLTKAGDVTADVASESFLEQVYLCTFRIFTHIPRS